MPSQNFIEEKMKEVSEKIDRFEYVLPDSHFDTEKLKKDFRQALEEAIAEERNRIMEGIKEIRGDLGVMNILMKVESIVNPK